MNSKKMHKILLYNTLSREKEVFSPIDKDEVHMYSCGPTVYNYPHIGNYRAYVFADILKRVLQYGGYKVKHVMNLTDIDDKTIRESQKEKKSLKEFTEFYTQEFLKDIIQWKSLLKEVSPNYEPKYARFPYGLGKNSQIKILNEEGLNLQRCITNIRRTRNWDVDSIDWHPNLVRSAKDVKRRINKFNSSIPVILLFHLTLAKPLTFGSRKVTESLITSDSHKFQKYC